MLTVAELIRILQAMPPDDTVLTRDSRLSDSMAVGRVISRNSYDKTPLVMIGSWAWVPKRTDGGDDWSLADGFYFAKNTYGDNREVQRMRLVLKPAERYQTWSTTDARIESVPDE